jgi:hypothetical protein
MVVVGELTIVLHNGGLYQILKFDSERNQLAVCWKTSEIFIRFSFGLADGFDGKISRSLFEDIFYSWKTVG